jgi:hypothetical protein
MVVTQFRAEQHVLDVELLRDRIIRKGAIQLRKLLIRQGAFPQGAKQVEELGTFCRSIHHADLSAASVRRMQ